MIGVILLNIVPYIAIMVPYLIFRCILYFHKILQNLPFTQYEKLLEMLSPIIKYISTLLIQSF